MDVGVISREPAKIYSAIHEMRETSEKYSPIATDKRSDEEIMEELKKLIRYSKSIG